MYGIDDQLLCILSGAWSIGSSLESKDGRNGKWHTFFSFIIFSCNLEKADSLRVGFAATRLFRWTMTFHWIQHEHDVSNMVSRGSYFLVSNTQSYFLCSFPSHESSQEASTIDWPSYQVRIRLWKYIVYFSIVLKFLTFYLVIIFARDSDKMIFDRLSKEFEAARASQSQGGYR